MNSNDEWKTTFPECESPHLQSWIDPQTNECMSICACCQKLFMREEANDINCNFIDVDVKTKQPVFANDGK